MNSLFIKTGLAACMIFIPSLLVAQNKSDTEKRLDHLERELERVKKEQDQKGTDSSILPKTDQDDLSGLSWAAYGEIKYIDHLSNYKADQFDVHRVVLLTEYRFNDWIDMLAEFEYEHAGFETESVAGSSVNAGSVFVEQAYINLRFFDALQFRPGLNLIPVGPVNIRHEPTTFLPVQRSRNETSIIPTTWREIGLVVHGEITESLSYQAGVVNGPRGSNFSESSWIRGGRTKGSKSRAEGLAVFMALKYEILNGLEIGSSYYRGDSGQGDISEINWQNRLYDPVDSWNDQSGLKTAYQEMLANQNKKGRVRVHIAEAHVTLRRGPWMGQAMFVQGWMNESDTREINKATGKNIGQRVEGAYAELGYNILSLLQSDHKLYPYIRLEYINTQKQTVERHWGGKDDIQDAICTALNSSCKSTNQLTNGNLDLGIIAARDSFQELYGVTGVPDRTNDQRILTLGVAWFPHPGVVIKAEYERQSSKSSYHRDIEARNSSNNKIDRFQMAVGFSI